MTSEDDSSPAKVWKFEHTEDAESSPIGFRRYYPVWVDKKGNEYAGDEAEEEEPVSNDEVKRLVKVLEKDPNKLNEVEQDQLCRYVDVEKIISVALKLGKEMGRGDLGNALEKLRETEVHSTNTYSMYETALESTLLLCKVKEGVSRSDLDEFLFLFHFLPAKLFAHVFYEKTGVHHFVLGEEETDNSDEEPKAPVYCPICCEKNSHLEPWCPYNKCVPLGAKIGPDYELICRVCGCPNEKEACPTCGLAGRRAVPKFCIVCGVDGECLKDDPKHRAFWETVAAERELDEYDRTEGGKRCSVCYEDDHSAENCWDKSNYAV